MRLTFDTWKRDFEPIIYEELGSYCHEHDGGWDGTTDCGCEYLRTWFPEELAPGGDDYDEHGSAIAECRVWTWHNQGIYSGIRKDAVHLLITRKPYTTETEIV